MEIPIVPIFEDCLMSLKDQNLCEKIRLLEMDGSYLISVLSFENITNRFVNQVEIAFSSLQEALNFLKDDLCIELSDQENPQDENWISYDHD